MKKFISSVLMAGMLVTTASCSKNEEPEQTSESTEAVTEAVIAPTIVTTSATTTAAVTYAPDNIEIDGEDTTPPLILSVQNNVTIHPGDEFDINRYISYIDDYDCNPVMTISGEVNVNRYDTYPLSITVTDNSGNSSYADINVTLAPVPPTSSVTPEPYEPPTIAWSDFYSNYKADNTLVGIDVSKWQGDIDFQAVKDAGCDFVMMRIAVYVDEFHVDEYYLQNIRAAKDAGLMVGVYYYSADNSAAILREHISQIMEILDGEDLDFPIAFDWESWNHCQTYGVSIAELQYLLDVFCEEVQTYGYEGMLYGSKYYLEAIFNNGNGHESWVAHYASSTDYQGDYSMWQVNCIGRIPGIDTDVDLDVYYLN